MASFLVTFRWEDRAATLPGYRKSSKRTARRMKMKKTMK